TTGSRSSRVGVRPLRRRRLAPASPAQSSSSPQRCAVAGAVYRLRDSRLTLTLAKECTCPSVLHADTSTVPPSRRAAKLKPQTAGRRSSPDAYVEVASGRGAPKSREARRLRSSRRHRGASLHDLPEGRDAPVMYPASSAERAAHDGSRPPCRPGALE